MKKLVYLILGSVVSSAIYLQGFAADSATSATTGKPGTANEQDRAQTQNQQEGANAASEMSNSGQPVKKDRTARNVRGRDGKVPTESSKNAQPSQLKTQERTKTVE